MYCLDKHRDGTLVAFFRRVMTKPFRETTRNHWKLSAIVVATACFAACAAAPRVADTPITPPVDHNRLEEMHKKYAGGLNLYNKGDFEYAIRTLEPVWLWNPNYEQVASYLTQSLRLSGLEFYAEQRYLAAIDRWEKALAVDPGNAKVERYLTRARQELQKVGQVEG